MKDLRRTGLTAMLVILAAVALLPAHDVGAADKLSLTGQNLRVEVERSPFVLTVTDVAGRELLATRGPISVYHETEPLVSRFILYWVWTRGLITGWQCMDQVVSAEEKDGALVLGLAARKSGDPAVTMKIYFLDDNTLKVETEATGAGVNRTKVCLKMDGQDRYFGMGERFNQVDHRGERVRVWAEEGGLGMNWVGEIPPLNFINPLPKGPDMTYYPMPYFLNPAKGYAFLLDDFSYSMFDFGVTAPGAAAIENWNKRFDFFVFYGPSPKEIVTNVTGRIGRITSVPQPWVYAPMNAVVESEARALEVARELRENQIPTSAIWSESWWWRVEWQVNREKYPHYEDMIARLHADGFRALGYYQPYISEKSPRFAEGASKGYFTKNRKGEPATFPLGAVKKAQVDLYNPEAVEWWKKEFFAFAEGMGVDGWMHDFGEHTPPYSVSQNGKSGWETHNEYSLLWAKVGREFWDQARPDGNYCFYIRGGYTGTQKYASVMWTGDQNASFEREDGLASNIPGILSIGLGGQPIVTTDIAGYNCFTNFSANREVFMRWTELGALLPVMRIHRGQDEVCNHWNFDQDRETLDHYKKYAVLHTALFPYFYTLSYEAMADGLPVIRHLMLEFPEDRETWKLDYQFLIGDRLLAAPVWKRHAKEWSVYLPAGEWVHWWSGKSYTGPGRVKVPAPLGEVPLFARAGKIIPMFDGRIDTLVKEDRPDIMGWDDANSSLKVLFFGRGDDRLTLWDGTVITCGREPGEDPGSCGVTDSPVERKFAAEFR